MTPWILVRDETALIKAGGRTILGRVLEMLKRAGKNEQRILCPAKLVEDVRKEAARIQASIEVIADKEEWQSKLEQSDDAVLLVDAHVIYDGRLLKWACEWDKSSVLVDSKPE
ncbi:MAG: hypothetical protein JRF33_08540, partial [Deltaproteobacteria bacterium]|nr:hypothetical protein [Deltaproteobacteria bacterium]